jgi:xanthine dehydrogenase accessory factor
MDIDILTELQQARADKRQVALATNLITGINKLYYPFDNNALNDIEEAAKKALLADKPAIYESPDGEFFINIFSPKLRMAIIGAVHIAQFLVPMATAAGYEVTVIDPRRSFGSDFRFPDVHLDNDWPQEAMATFDADRRSAIITLTHDAKLDDPALVGALKSDAFYIGALGSNRTHGKRHDRLREAGFSDTDIARIHGPIGLDIGAKSPAEIAISIIAEVTQTLRNQGIS